MGISLCEKEGRVLEEEAMSQSQGCLYRKVYRYVDEIWKNHLVGLRKYEKGINKPHPISLLSQHVAE